MSAHRTLVWGGRYRLQQVLADDPHCVLSRRRQHGPGYEGTVWDPVDVFHLADGETLEHLRDTIVTRMADGSY